MHIDIYTSSSSHAHSTEFPDSFSHHLSLSSNTFDGYSMMKSELSNLSVEDM